MHGNGCACRPRLALAALGLLPLAMCNSPSEVGATGGANGGGGVVINLTLASGGTTGATQGRTGSAPTPDANCGNQATALTQLPADLLLVLDRSGSMTNDITTDDPCDPLVSTCVARWDALTAGMAKVLASAPPSISWGLKLFSTPGVTGAQGATPEGCVVSPGMEVPVGAANAATILQKMAATAPNYNTPTRAAIATATAYLATVNDSRPKYLLLATDGQPNCAVAGAYATEPDMAATLAAIGVAFGAGIKTFVIGVGPSTGNLDQMAERGGTGGYYPALTPESLTQALATIAGIVASCAYDMGAAPLTRATSASTWTSAWFPRAPATASSCRVPKPSPSPVRPVIGSRRGRTRTSKCCSVARAVPAFRRSFPDSPGHHEAVDIQAAGKLADASEVVHEAVPMRRGHDRPIGHTAIARPQPGSLVCRWGPCRTGERSDRRRLGHEGADNTGATSEE